MLQNDILDCSKIEAGKVLLESKDVDLRVLVAEVAELFAPKVREKGLALVTTVDLALPACVRADPVRLRQVLMNLVGNAVKSTERGGVTVELGAALRGATGIRLRVAVRDTGIGIPADRRDAIFDSFTQVNDSTTRVYGGTGSASPICRELVWLMGRRIGVESEVGEGSTFWFDVALTVSEMDRGAEAGSRRRRE